MATKQIDLTQLALSELQQLLGQVTQRIDELLRTPTSSSQYYAAGPNGGCSGEPAPSAVPSTGIGEFSVETLSERVRGLNFANDPWEGTGASPL